MCISRSVFTCRFNCICQILNVILKTEVVSFRTGLCILLAFNCNMSSTRSCANESEPSTAACKVMCIKHVCWVQLGTLGYVFCSQKACGGIGMFWTILFHFLCWQFHIAYPQSHIFPSEILIVMKLKKQLKGKITCLSPVAKGAEHLLGFISIHPCPVFSVLFLFQMYFNQLCHSVLVDSVSMTLIFWPLGLKAV